VDLGLALAVVGIVAIACQWLGWRLGLPAILFLLPAGILIGPVAGVLRPDEQFGDLLLPMVSMAVSVILFEGSLTLKLAELRGVQKVVLRLVSVGIVITWTVTAIATHLFVGLSWSLAILFGALMVVTGPTVIAPMLRTVRPAERVAQALRWEGILTDPFGAVLAILVFQFIASSDRDGELGHHLAMLGVTALIGVTIGVIGGYVFGLALRKAWLPKFLHNFTALGVVFAVFALSNHVAEESGLLAVTVMGIWLVNMPGVDVEDILDFKESLSLVLISGLFILLAARLDFGMLRAIGWPSLAVLAAVQFIARPLKVMVSTVGSALPWGERVLLAWIGPRGIVAAAVSAAFAFKLEALGDPQALYLVPLTFVVIIGTVVLQGATAGWLARALHAAEPEPRGFLVVGANRLARAIAKVLNQTGFRTVLADATWENVRQARQEGLDTYYGNPVSEHAERQLNLAGIGRLLGLSPQSELNTLAIIKFRRELGTDEVYALCTADAQDLPENLRTAAPDPAHLLFGPDATYARLTRKLSEGWQVVAETLAEGETLKDWLAARSEGTSPMFAIDPRARIQVFTASVQPEPKHEWRLIALVPPSTDADSEGEGKG